MGLLAITLSYISVWVVTRGGLSISWLIALIGMYGVLAYFATYSIAMWKDPLFSCAISLLSIRLLDLVWHDFKFRPAWLLSICALALFASLIRNNGIIIVAFVLASFFLVAILERKARRSVIPIAIALASTVCVSLAIIGPFYSILGIQPSPAAESLAVPLNQMARVAALDGDMTKEDAAYMNELLEDGDFVGAYSPTSVDRFKWDSSFNAQLLKDGFFSHWMSMFLNNPVVFFQAWELETCGWWAVNCPQVNMLGNISYGDPRNVTDFGKAKLDELGIEAVNLLQSEETNRPLVLDGWFPPVSWIAWLLLYLALCLLLARKKGDLLGLIPSMGIVLTFLLASPIWYWQRYGVTLQILLPVFILLFYTIKQKE